MVVDFGDLKRELRKVADSLDHKLIYEKGSLKPATEAALADEGFATVVVPFRPTAENLARYIYEKLEGKFDLESVTVYETPDNCAVYRK